MSLVRQTAIYSQFGISLILSFRRLTGTAFTASVRILDTETRHIKFPFGNSTTTNTPIIETPFLSTTATSWLILSKVEGPHKILRTSVPSRNPSRRTSGRASDTSCLRRTWTELSTIPVIQPVEIAISTWRMKSFKTPAIPIPSTLIVGTRIFQAFTRTF